MIKQKPYKILIHKVHTKNFVKLTDTDKTIYEVTHCGEYLYQKEITQAYGHHAVLDHIFALIREHALKSGNKQAEIKTKEKTTYIEVYE